MKKIIGILSLLLAVVVLAACQNQSASSQSDKSSESKAVTKDSSEEDTSSEASEDEEVASDEKTGMDVEAIRQGDFSSVVGTWRDGAGHTMSFDEQGLVSDTSYVKLDYVRDVGGILNVGVSPKAYGAGGYMLFFAPKGTTFPTGNDGQGDASDSSKDRIFSSQQEVFSDASTFYYRVDDSEVADTSDVSTADSQTKRKSQSVEEAIQRTDTGVTLSGGQSSSDYATKILGDQGWVTTSGTYGRTSGVPQNYVTNSSNESVFVYQNGVIISQDNQILYEP